MLFLLAVLQDAPPAAVERTGAFASRRVSESSGVAVSRAHAGVLWTHNDSGDDAVLYATDVTGADRGRVRIPGVAPRDAEDLAEGPCPERPGRCLYLADTGDNREERGWVAVYGVPEPEPPAGAADTLRTTAPGSTLRVRYPDGPHDVEAAFVTADATVYLVTKGRRGSVRVYRAARMAWSAGGVVTAEFVQTLTAGESALRAVTGAALAPNGRDVVVRTYGEVAFFALGPDGTLGPLRARCSVRGHEPQGEAVAFLDDRRLVLTSEARGGTPGPIHVVVCPPAGRD
jgi:hypothetical protein